MRFNCCVYSIIPVWLVGNKEPCSGVLVSLVESGNKCGIWSSVWMPEFKAEEMENKGFLCGFCNFSKISWLQSIDQTMSNLKQLKLDITDITKDLKLNETFVSRIKTLEERDHSKPEANSATFLANVETEKKKQLLKFINNKIDQNAVSAVSESRRCQKQNQLFGLIQSLWYYISCGNTFNRTTRTELCTTVGALGYTNHKSWKIFKNPPTLHFLQESYKFVQESQIFQICYILKKPYWRPYWKSYKYRRKLFRKPSRYYSQKRQNGKISFRFTETQWNHREKEGTNAEYEELISRMSRKIVDGEADEIWISKFDLDYAYGQLPLSKNAMDLCIFPVTGGNFTGYYRFLKGFYGLAGIPTIFQEKIDKTLENKHPAL